MNREVEEAVKIVSNINMPLQLGVSQQDAVKVLLALAQDYLAIKGLPEERSQFKKREMKIGYMAEDYNAGFNQSLHLCKLAMLKKEVEWKEGIPSVEEIGHIIGVRLNIDYRNSLGITQAIHKMLERMR